MRGRTGGMECRRRRVGKSVDPGPTGPKSQPWRGATMKTVGRLFFVNADGADSWCTATAVRSGNRSVLMTAGHCVRRPASPVNTYIDWSSSPATTRVHSRTAPSRCAPP